MHRFIISLLSSFLLSPLVWADSALRSEVDSAFSAGHYEHIELLVLRADRMISALSVDDRVNINLTAGYSMIMLNREADAREYFRRALDADPTTRLDPVRISPKFRMVFDEVKSAYRSDLRNQPYHPEGGAYSRPSARSVLSNLILPGSGQWLEGARLRGTVILGINLATAGVFLWRLNELEHSRTGYIQEQDRSQVAAAYDKYYDDYRWAWVSGITAGLIYLGTQADLTLLRKPVAKGITLLHPNPVKQRNLMVSLVSYQW